jgi:Cu2+-exporting ATPase
MKTAPPAHGRQHHIHAPMSRPDMSSAGHHAHLAQSPTAGHEASRGHDRHAGHSVQMFHDRFWITLLLDRDAVDCSGERRSA